MLEREQMSAKNLNIKLNLVGFDSDLTDKFTKQIDAINRMNTARNHLQYHWEIGQNAYQCQVHFVIDSTLPHYLNQSKAPILSNQNLVAEHLIPCSHPITTFDLIDVLANIEQTFFMESPVQQSGDTDDKPNITFWRDGEMTVPTQTEESPIVHHNQTDSSEAEADDKPVFYTYGSFRKNQTSPPTHLTEAAQKATAEKQNIQTLPSASNNLSTSSQASSDTEADNHSKEKFILYGSLKTNANQKKTTDFAVSKTNTPTEDPIDKDSNSIDASKTDTNSIANISLSAESMTETKTQDVWESLSKQSSGIICLKKLNVYVDYDNQMIAAAVNHVEELASILLQVNNAPIETTKKIPNTLKHFSLPAVLWSYGLHTPNCDEKSQNLDLENQEWKLKGFPRFGQWETHPTWLFLATLFAQDYHSIYAAQAKGKVSQQQVKHFIYAAHLAGLTWKTQALPENIKQKQQDSLQQTASEKSSWISRLREKLHTNEHFESSLD